MHAVHAYCDFIGHLPRMEAFSSKHYVVDEHCNREVSLYINYTCYIYYNNNNNLLRLQTVHEFLSYI